MNTTVDSTITYNLQNSVEDERYERGASEHSGRGRGKSVRRKAREKFKR